jgi:hypothetical protein
MAPKVTVPWFNVTAPLSLAPCNSTWMGWPLDAKGYDAVALTYGTTEHDANYCGAVRQDLTPRLLLCSSNRGSFLPPPPLFLTSPLLDPAIWGQIRLGKGRIDA